MVVIVLFLGAEAGFCPSPLASSLPDHSPPLEFAQSLLVPYFICSNLYREAATTGLKLQIRSDNLILEPTGSLVSVSSNVNTMLHYPGVYWYFLSEPPPTEPPTPLQLSLMIMSRSLSVPNQRHFCVLSLSVSTAFKSLLKTCLQSAFADFNPSGLPSSLYVWTSGEGRGGFWRDHGTRSGL